MSKPMSSLRLILLAVALLLPQACRKKAGESQASPTNTSTTTQNIQAVPDRSMAANPVVPPRSDAGGSTGATAATGEYQVDLLEYSIHVTSPIPAGHQTLRISNAGKENHGLVLEGNGRQVQLPENLSRGNTTKLAVDLSSGTYNVWCPVEGHKEKGMSTTFTVK